jgi:hypothetical protein
MLGLSWSETLIIIVIAILFLGVEDYKKIILFAKRVKKRISLSLFGHNSEVNKIMRDSGLIELKNDLTHDIDQINAEIKQVVGDDGKLYDAYDIAEFIKSQEENEPQQKH